MEKKIIDQKFIKNITVEHRKDIGIISIYNSGKENPACFEEEHDREVALAICPQIEEEISDMKDLIQYVFNNLPDNALKEFVKSKI